MFPIGNILHYLPTEIHRNSRAGKSRADTTDSCSTFPIGKACRASLRTQTDEVTADEAPAGDESLLAGRVANERVSIRRAAREQTRDAGRLPAIVCRMLSLTFSFLLLLAGPAAQSAQPGVPTELYRFVLVQAAPGRLLELIDLYKGRLPVIAAGGDQAPYIVRHSQGDRWDLLVIYPSGSFTSYYSAERVRQRAAAADKSGVSNAEFARKFYELVAWHEDVYLEGPPLAVFREYVNDLGLVHFEMFQALPAKREALIEERRMESAFNIGRGRPGALIFTHEQGAAWDVMTLDGYRNWRHYAESETIPKEVTEAAAKKAGFENADAVGPYMRSLISLHHDTIGTPVK